MSLTDPRSLTTALTAEARRLGFESVGAAPLTPSDHESFLRDWLDQGRHGAMGYLAREDALAARADPRTRWPDLRSALVVAHHYDAGNGTRAGDGAGTGQGDTAVAGEEDGAGTGVIARYARGRDYHRVVKRKLMDLLRWLEGEVGRELPSARAYVDTGPVLERELARRAGLGWFGRNTMLIDPRRGSYFFLGSLLLPFELEYDDPFDDDRCGTCHACLDACPTGALLGRDENGAPVMDARLCISYLTIENPGPIPRELRPLIGNRVYGCDICQEVCPWNAPKLVRITGERDYRPDWRDLEDRPDVPDGFPRTDSPSLAELLEMALDEIAWDQFSSGSAIRRAGRAGFARNVCVGLGNSGAPEAVPVLRAALWDPEPLVREHAAWALGRIRSPESRSALSSRAAVESNVSVVAELSAALAS